MGPIVNEILIKKERREKEVDDRRNPQNYAKGTVNKKLYRI